ncbi:hypothetical protein ACSYDW_07245 [Paeniglutamicibacter sp. R2-26]|uniref:hypothetical protein n=1 Tax=Paeniglutamicibacter sp. R2-26 TaxID=3144417 RepID=UPI003EE64439
MSLVDAFMEPHFNGLHLLLLVIGLVAAWFAVRPDPAPSPEPEAPLRTEIRIPHFNLEPCSCPSGNCPEWERKAGLTNPDPECPIHGEQDQAA